MIAYVLDASVAAKWFLPATQESLTAEALQILREFSRGQIRLLVPDLFWAEFGNVLWKAARTDRISRKSAEDSVQAIEQAGLETVSSATLLRNAFAIASTTDRTVYDAIYVAAAIDRGCPFVTADERLADVLAARFPVRWLGVLY